MSLAKRNSEAAAQWAAKRRESQERALLQERSGPSSRRGLSTTAMQRPPPRRFRASTSHEANAEYMDDFRRGMANMYLALEGPSDGKGEESEAGAYRKTGKTRRPDLAGGSSGSMMMASSRGSRLSGQHVERSKRAVLSGFGSLAEELKTSSTGDGAASGWHQGPLDPAGNLLDLSDRNLLCASVLDDEAVFGCADHALYCVDLARGVKTRRLYGSRSKPDAGHKEWVSAVCHTARGDIASGGMDGKLCLWPRGGGNPGEVQAHAGSISAIKADAEGRVVTSGYGGALRVWDCRGGGRGGSPPAMSGEISDRGLPAPCMDFAWAGPRAMTGHRDGRVGVFDLETGALVAGGGKGGAHRGHVTVVKALDGINNGGYAAATGSSRNSGADCCCFVTGGQDGFVRVWDTRAGEIEGGAGRPEKSGGGPAVALEAPAHRGPAGVGAVGDVIAAGGAGAGGSRLASFGADKRVCVFDTRGGRGGGGGSSTRGRPAASSLAMEHVFDDHRDFIYCMDFVPACNGAATAGGGGGGILITGGGDGMLLAHDLDSMRLLYGLGCCSAGAVRCAIAGESRLTVGGDDGNAMLYSFGGGGASDEREEWSGK